MDEASTIVTRTVQFEARALNGDTGDGNTLVGLAVPFDSPTRIDNIWEGTFDEQFVKGAFKRSLGLRTPVLQFEHGRHPMIGQLPIGEFRAIEETDRGVEIEARLFESELFDPLREALLSEAIHGMSIRFRPLKIDIDLREDDDDHDVPLQTIREAELHELGPVVFPAYSDTEVDLRGLDMSDKNDRRRLAEALLRGAATVGDGPDQLDGPGTDAGAASPATNPDQGSAHSGKVAPRRKRRHLRAVRLNRQLESINGPASPEGRP